MPRGTPELTAASSDASLSMAALIFFLGSMSAMCGWALSLQSDPVYIVTFGGERGTCQRPCWSQG